MQGDGHLYFQLRNVTQGRVKNDLQLLFILGDAAPLGHDLEPVLPHVLLVGAVAIPCSGCAKKIHVRVREWMDVWTDG